MRTFNFSLERVHSYRQAVEGKLKQELSGLARERDREQQELAALAAEQARRQAKAKPAGQLDVNEAMQASLYLESLDLKRKAQAGRVEQAEERVAGQQERVIAAMRERKVLDRLRQRQEQAYQQELAREQQKEVDERAVIGYNQRR